MLNQPYINGYMATGDCLGAFVKIGPLIDTNYKYRLNSLCTKAHINPVLTLSNTNKLASLQLY